MDTLEKVWHRIQSCEKSIFLRRLLTLQTVFSEPWFLPDFHLWACCRKFCTRRNFESSKEPKTHLWKQVLILNLKLLQENMYKLYCVPTVHGLSWKSFNYDPKKARLICGSYIEDSSFQPQQKFLSYSNILASNVQNFSFFAQILILFVTWWPRHNTY